MRCRELDADAEFHVLHLVAGVGVGVVGGAMVEFVALAQLTADEQAERDGTKSGGDPGHGLQQGTDGWAGGGFIGLMVEQVHGLHAKQ